MTNTTPIAVEINCETGEVIERPFTAEELAVQAELIAQSEADRIARETEEAAKATVKEAAHAKLAALGLTAEEIAALS